MVSDVRLDAERRMVIRRLQGREHFKEILEPPGLAGNDAMGALFAGILRQQLGHVIGDPAVIQPRAPQDMPHQHIEIQMRRNAQTPPVFEQRPEQKIVIKNQIPRLGVRQKGCQRSRLAIASTPPQHAENEIDVQRRELDPAICLNHLHRLKRQQVWFHIRL